MGGKACASVTFFLENVFLRSLPGGAAAVLLRNRHFFLPLKDAGRFST